VSRIFFCAVFGEAALKDASGKADPSKLFSDPWFSPLDAVDTLSKSFFAPVLEKMLAAGAIFEWETDTYADPKDAPGTFLIAYLSATAEGLDKGPTTLCRSASSLACRQVRHSIPWWT
jgi:hypothetical protein